MSLARTAPGWLLLGVLAACAAAPPAPVAEDDAEAEQAKAAGHVLDAHPPSKPDEPLLSRVRQLTFAGRRSGEGYFSQDGRQIVFQSEREPGNPFYQIYWMDLDRGHVQRVSPGVGKTTCGWIHPTAGRVLFASTHLDPDASAEQERELAARASDEARRYSWDYDEHYDLFSVAIGESGRPGAMQRLTTAHGYDAEASWSPDGRTIVFTSNRSAYDRKNPLSKDDQERLAVDPSYFAELYTLDVHSREVRRLTERPGYDGGPFFSPDGERIVWRRFSQDGARAEVFSMKRDGSDVRQLTNLGAMSWAPFYHPSGDYVAFATNRHGFENFEVYLAPSEGLPQGADMSALPEPVRVTSWEGFDGLPAFAPDGNTLAWSSRRAGRGQTQLFTADWNDREARRRLDLAPAHETRGVRLLPLPKESSAAITNADLQAHVATLTSDATEGRLTGTAGERIATSYVARAFRALGLEPAGENGTFFQDFSFTAGISLAPGNRLELIDPDGGARSFEVDTRWRPLTFSRLGEIPAARVTFAGYGIVAPEGPDTPALDAYEGLDVAGRWVFVFRYMPDSLSPEARQHLNRFSSLRYKAMVARDHGALGLLVVSGPTSKVREPLVALRLDVTLAGTSVAAVSIDDALARSILASHPISLAELQRDHDTDLSSRGFAIRDTRLAANIALAQQRRTGRNVLGRLPASHPPRLADIVVGAHVDHLGHGESSTSLARGDEKGRIHPGADDNASGVAALLEMAQWLADLRERGELQSVRDIVLAAWSGEELGLLGSAHYATSRTPAEPTAGHAAPVAHPHAAVSEANPDLGPEVAAYLNMDMVGRENGALLLYGVGSSSVWPRVIEARNAPIELPISTQNESYLPTDATSFYLRRVPILSAFTGNHDAYHTPRDTADRLDFERLRDVARLMGGVTATLARAEDAPDYVESRVPENKERRAGLRVYLGTIPDYAQGDIEGLRLSGVAQGGPADAAGLRAGDVIVEVAGRRIENIYDYTFALEALRVGEPARIVVERGDERVTLEITPSSRD